LRAALDAEDPKAAVRSGEAFQLGEAHALYNTLLAPLESIIRNKSHLIVVPSGPLTSLPLHVLVTDQPSPHAPGASQLAHYRESSWLMRRHAISVIPSIGSLKNLRALDRNLQGTKPLFGVANPTFGQRPRIAEKPPALVTGSTRKTNSGLRGYATYWRGGTIDRAALQRGLHPLPETEYELRTVAGHVGATERDLKIGLAASETVVKGTDLLPYRILYFATHGLVAGEVKGLGEPALVLSLSENPSETDDGLLTASEVAQLRLNAEWVVLSACNTAAGDQPGAEALSGLARAFFYAGARALLVSHWRVDSHAAVRLTTSTFGTMQRELGVGRAEALRRAMVEFVRDHSDPWNAYPAYWAAFSIVGEGGR